jgi:hypothetical protein
MTTINEAMKAHDWGAHTDTVKRLFELFLAMTPDRQQAFLSKIER